MGLEFLENRFQEYKSKYPQDVPGLKNLAKQVEGTQKKVRKVLDSVTPALCSTCHATCCKGMPVDGWFTAGDYFLYRMLYDTPVKLKVEANDERSCSFLATTGCTLPCDMRPFACVKVNCERLDQKLKKAGEFDVFMILREELDNLQEALWRIIQRDFL
jgi:hypothetical protein